MKQFFKAPLNLDNIGHEIIAASYQLHPRTRWNNFNNIAHQKRESKCQNNNISTIREVQKNTYTRHERLNYTLSVDELK